MDDNQSGQEVEGNGFTTVHLDPVVMGKEGSRDAYIDQIINLSDSKPDLITTEVGSTKDSKVVNLVFGKIQALDNAISNLTKDPSASEIILNNLENMSKDATSGIISLSDVNVMVAGSDGAFAILSSTEDGLEGNYGFNGLPYIAMQSISAYNGISTMK